MHKRNQWNEHAKANQTRNILILTGVPGHHAGSHNHSIGVIARPMHIVRRLDRAREQLIRRGIASGGGDGCWLKASVKGIGQRERATCRRAFLRDPGAKRLIGKVKLPSEVLEELCIGLFNFVQRAISISFR